MDYPRLRIHGCQHCGGTQSLEWEGYKFSINNHPIYKCNNCSRAIPITEAYPPQPVKSGIQKLQEFLGERK